MRSAVEIRAATSAGVQPTRYPPRHGRRTGDRCFRPSVSSHHAGGDLLQLLHGAAAESAISWPSPWGRFVRDQLSGNAEAKAVAWMIS